MIFLCKGKDKTNKIKVIKTTKLIDMGIQLEADNMTAALKAIEVIHQGNRSKPMISTTRQRS